MSGSPDPKPSTTFIFTPHQRFDNAGRLVEDREIISGDPPDDWCRFVGRSVLNVDDGRGNILGQQPIQFPIPEAESLKEAFAQFDELGGKAAAEVAEQIRERQRAQSTGIVVPGQGRRG